MLIIELGRTINESRFAPVATATYQTYPVKAMPADWWRSVFGVDEDLPTETTYIQNFYENVTTSYIRAASVQDCIDTESSFFWDEASQLLTVHFSEGNSWYTTDYRYERIDGFTNQDVVYVDDIEYLPRIISAPSAAQQEDIVNYNKLAFISGRVTMDNTEGDFDYLTTEDIYGQSVNIKYLDSADIINQAVTRSDLIGIAALYVEDYDPGIKEIDIRVQDIRKAQNVKIPRDVFTTANYPNIEEKYINTPIPLIYGPIAEFPCIPVTGDTTGDVTFKVGKALTAIGQIQVFSEDVWTNVSASSTALSSGEFVLSSADCRKDGTTSGDILDVRVLSCTGEAVTDSADVISLLNLETLGIEYNDRNYDTTEWTAEKASLSQIGVAFTEKIELFEAIRLIQNGSSIGFRYEIKPDGRRTIRIDDPARAIVATAENIDIQNLYSLKPQTSSRNLAAVATVNYKKNYSDDLYRVYIDDSQRDAVRKRYRQEPEFTVETFLQTEAIATLRASYIIDRFSTISTLCPLSLMGKQWYGLRIYDTIDVELTPGVVDRDFSGSTIYTTVGDTRITTDGDTRVTTDGDTRVLSVVVDKKKIMGREYFGIWKALVVSVNPSYDQLLNNVTVLLLEEL